ncbi:hypothetical protein SAMN05421594_2606 [Chryseobacterium oleae]|uniref:Uncharacterized protein n=1 Tax=Chryseobacterium oleae TaxID=491207 RepID=A0A1I4YQH4_CHROL|nr:hypothetical protein [Chryseobacterium oleae]SFN40285.1 hypothetical protein SAMN05421594_2606 [Chryseobacterium oleae]
MMIKRHYLLLFLLLICGLSCESSINHDADVYFSVISDEVTKIRGKVQKVKALKNRELEKFKRTRDRKYLISSKYVELFYYFDKGEVDGTGQIPVVYDLLILNNNEYDFITIACNFNLAFQFETLSPRLSMGFLNKAIQLEETHEKKHELPHLYHLKGRLFYNKKNYSQAMHYFKKCLNTLSLHRKDLIFVASMYNNFGLCYDKMGLADRALKEVSTAISILESQKKLTTEEEIFLMCLKSNKGLYHYKRKEYALAGALLTEVYEFNKNKRYFHNEAVQNLMRLFNLYQDTEQISGMREAVNYAASIEPEIKKIPDKIQIFMILQSYYLKINDISKVSGFCKKLMELHNQDEQQRQKKLTYVSDVLNNFLIKDLTLKQMHKIDNQKFNNKMILAGGSVCILIFAGLVYFNQNTNKKEREIAEKEKVILIKNKKILEHEVKQQEEKISNMHLNLNLKIETEKTFLEYIKNIKKAKNVDTEQTLNDLFVKINNLIQIDRNNNDLINESSAENAQLIKKLSARFPDLTNNEIKFCIYYKLGLSSKEIAILENITEGSSRVYKTRIKSKMNIGREVDLNLFLKVM